MLKIIRVKIKENHFNSFNELFSLEEYKKFLESKRVRPTLEQTQTELDFITLEEERKLRKQGKIKIIQNLKELDPTPEHLKRHFKFIREVFSELYNSNQKDEFLIALSSDSRGVIIK